MQKFEKPLTEAYFEVEKRLYHNLEYYERVHRKDYMAIINTALPRRTCFFWPLPGRILRFPQKS